MDFQLLLTYIIRFSFKRRVTLAGISALFIFLIGILSMYCAQQGFLMDSYFLLAAHGITHNFYSNQIEANIPAFSPRMRLVRQLFMNSVITCIILPATFSFYFDLELFSFFHIYIVIFTIIQYVSVVYFGLWSTQDHAHIRQYRIFGSITYPLSPEILLIPLFFHVIGYQYLDIQWHLGIGMALLNFINFPLMPRLLQYCFSENCAQFILTPTEFALRRSNKLYILVSMQMNALLNKLSRKP